MLTYYYNTFPDEKPSNKPKEPAIVIDTTPEKDSEAPDFSPPDVLPGFPHMRVSKGALFAIQPVHPLPLAAPVRLGFKPPFP